MIRTIAAILIALIAAWLFWQGAHAVQVIVSRGSPLDDALLQPPTSIWRLVASGLALLGGVLAALNIRGGGWFAMIGAVLFAALGGALAAMGTDPSIWMDEAIAGAVLVVLAAVLVVVKRS